MNSFQDVSLYAIFALISVSAIFFLAIIIHLSYVCRQKSRLKTSKRKQIQFFLIITIVAVLMYELLSIALIFVYLQIILIQTDINQDTHKSDHIYYDSFHYMEFVIVIVNDIAHLCVILVFIIRFHHTFHNNLFTNNRQIIALYSCEVLLFIAAIMIVLMMAFKHDERHIIIAELCWEILGHCMWIWLLYIFIAKLYGLLKLSLQSHNGKTHSELIKSLIEATKLSRSGSKHSQTTLKYGQNSNKSTVTMTIDGVKVVSTKRQSPATSRQSSPEPSVHTDGEQTDNERSVVQKLNEMKESTTLELIGVMTKMSVLVMFTVFVSWICAITHTLIETREIEHAEQHYHAEIATEAMWAEMCQMTDAVFTSLMLYLQFNFTHKTYRRIFGRFDAWFLKHCLQFIEFLWNKKLKNDTKSGSFLAETQSTKTSD